MGGRHAVPQPVPGAGPAPWGEPQPAYQPGYAPAGWQDDYDPELSFTPDLSWQPPAMRQQAQYQAQYQAPFQQMPDAGYASGYYDTQSFDNSGAFDTFGYAGSYDYTGYQQPYAAPYTEPYVEQYAEPYPQPQYAPPTGFDPAWDTNALYDTAPQPIQDASTAAPWDTPISLEYHHEAYHEPFLADPYDPYEAYAIPEQRGYDDYQPADEAPAEPEAGLEDTGERPRGRYAPPEYIGGSEPKKEAKNESAPKDGARPYATDAAGRRRPAKRKGPLALASTPVAVVGVAAVAAAAVGGIHLADGTKSSDAAADPSPTATGLDSKLLQMRAEAQALADRASRAEQRTELAQQAAIQRAKIEAMRPKFVLPVTGYILTAGFGQAGEHWQNLHTGQDFAVSVGTQVHAVQDGVVTAAGWDGAYGYRVVVTAADGTETWYCHLSAIKIRSGPVKAGTVIAYSGDTGNTTGPHLHFEVRIDGTPIDPMPWLRSHGLNP